MSLISKEFIVVKGANGSYSQQFLLQNSSAQMYFAPKSVAKDADSQLYELGIQQRIAVDAVQLDDFAARVGVKASSLTQLEIGWSSEHGMWTFPMYDGRGSRVGIALHDLGGRLLGAPYGRLGLFKMPSATSQQQLVIVGSVLDAAAMIDLGLPALGLSSWAALEFCDSVIHKYRIHTVTILLPQDGGVDIAQVARCISPIVRTTKLLRLPDSIKDVASWKNQGVSRREVEQAIYNAGEYFVRVVNCGKGAR